MFHKSSVYLIIIVKKEKKEKKREKKEKESIDFAFCEVQVSSCKSSNQS
jgi:hypothetical protein